MALPAPNLDDRRFQDLVDEAKRAIPRHCPEWTNHNLNDPGVALIELFAWMGEQLLFRLNQVPERLYVHFLNMVGIDRFGPEVARCDLLFRLSTALEEDSATRQVTVPAGTQIATDADTQTEAVVFSTDRDLVLRAPRLMRILTAASSPQGPLRDLREDLVSGVPAACFTSARPSTGDGLYLGFAEALAGTLLRLDLHALGEGIGVNPLDPPVAWEAWTGDGWAPARVLHDGTGGLNRDGRVELLMPHSHGSTTIGPFQGHWVRAVMIPPRPGQPTYDNSPRLLALSAAAVGGTVSAQHCERIGSEVLGHSTGRPGQVLRTSRSPLLSPDPVHEYVEVIDVAGAGTDVISSTTRWTAVRDFSASGPDDRHVVWDGAAGEIRFGPSVRQADGTVREHGAVPPVGARIGVTGYRVGGGARGNVEAGALVNLRSTLPYVTGVTNLDPATGGVDPETVEEAKIRGPLALRTGMRAVTAGDYELLARQASPAVARAHCLRPDGSNEPVRLLLVPRCRRQVTEQVIDDYALEGALEDTVRDHLEKCRMLGVRVELGTPFYQGVSVGVLLDADSAYDPTGIRQRAIETICRFVNPLEGGPEGTGWPFDTDLTSAALTQLLKGLDGVERVEEVLLFEYDLRERLREGEGLTTLRLGPRSLFLSAAPAVVIR